jgi:hypothetical protein
MSTFLNKIDLTNQYINEGLSFFDSATKSGLHFLSTEYAFSLDGVVVSKVTVKLTDEQGHSIESTGICNALIGSDDFEESMESAQRRALNGIFFNLKQK